MWRFVSMLHTHTHRETHTHILHTHTHTHTHTRTHAHTHTLGYWYAVQSCHSVLLTSALMEGHIDVATTADMSRLETRHQVLYHTHIHSSVALVCMIESTVC